MYVLSVDQSTQGTKGLIFDSTGRLIARADLPHQQCVNEFGWVSHRPNEIYDNLIKVVVLATEKAQIDINKIACMGISNQRETTLAWNRENGEPICDAIVWQCSRSEKICQQITDSGYAPMIQSRTGIPVSPYFPASKLAWMLENIPSAKQLASTHKLCMGTVDTWLLWKLTQGAAYKTDYSNASRTQLFNLNSLAWDTEICDVFGINALDLPEVCASDEVFGTTTLGGLLNHAIPICGVLGDSHAALFGQNCLERGMTKATYGTGSSVMMNIGDKPVFSGHGLVTSLAWKWKGQVQYVLEGNLNYTGAVISWLQRDIGLVASAKETEELAKAANPDDTTYLVPAFTGLGAPYWNSNARAIICGITRLTGKAELVKAALDCIAFQIADVVNAMQQDTGLSLPMLKVDGGATRNRYLMQLQSDILNVDAYCPDAEELSGIGVAYMAGLSFGIFTDQVFNLLGKQAYHSQMSIHSRTNKLKGWHEAVSMACATTT